MNLKNPEIIIINENEYLIPSDISEVVASIFSFLQNDTGSGVTIVFIEEEEMSLLYKQYYGYTHNTDVLSFESGEIDPESGRIMLGDILICYPFVEKQAISLGNKLDDEIKLLVIHGMLHLLGFDHATEEQKLRMWEVQNKLLALNDINLNRMPE